MGSPASAEDQPATKLTVEAARAADEARELQESAAAMISRAWNDEQSLRQRVSVLESTIKKIESSIRCNPNINRRDAEKLEEELCRARCIIRDGDIGSLLPSKSQGLFLKMFLGPINVRAVRKDVQLKVKEEYNNYRGVLEEEKNPKLKQPTLNIHRMSILDEDRTTFLFLLFPSILLCLRSLVWDGCFPALAVQLYQNIYQRQRLYTRIALGKAKRMDVVWGETAGVEGQLWFLCPILFILQAFEAYVGLLLLKTAVVGVVSEWQRMKSRSRLDVDRSSSPNSARN
ncbi:hypothetical protein QJS04_geneDACA013204 [Acorus gramineus]|uniref:Uncharacterized protein n=1 Tax=Acorus gramineus TaxID=55184 RepID=A0AAV9B9N3_ACOGR|nr:hypothetical protein QJS04_geneDACA013204 [Acorus gramineus]